MISNSQIFILGANGFVGTQVCRYFQKVNQSFIPVTRDGKSSDYDNEISLSSIFCDEPKLQIKSAIIINAIGAAHISEAMHKANPRIFEEANELIVEKLIKLCSKSDVAQVVHISSIGVLGRNLKGLVKQNTAPAPIEPYAWSKFKCEQILINNLKNEDTKLVIIRPTLVYGRNAKGNFSSLLNFVDMNLPLPINSLKNKKSFISDQNLSSFIHLVCTSNNIRKNVYNISDLETMEVRDFIIHLAQARYKRPRTLHIPLFLLKFGLSIIGKKNVFYKISEDFSIDLTDIIDDLNWTPVETQKEALERIARK